MLRVVLFSESQNADATHSELARLQRFGATRDRAKKILPPAPPSSCFLRARGNTARLASRPPSTFRPQTSRRRAVQRTPRRRPISNSSLHSRFTHMKKKRKGGQTKGWSSSSSELLSVFLQRSVPIQPKTNNNLPKSCRSAIVSPCRAEATRREGRRVAIGRREAVRGARHGRGPARQQPSRDEIPHLFEIREKP